MKKFFEAAELEIMAFAAADIITTSNQGPFLGEDDDILA